ncbi:MAG TPA: class I SAM-dependent methyltransferase [Microthrixaceae bacterium]|nr:class I SAM-dependent methyltransferase [Microthrixaceae bacterium]
MDQQLARVLDRSRSLGLLGPGDIGAHVENAKAFAELVSPADRVLDLGSGGGVPGLVLVSELPTLRVTLVDASERRVAFLRSAVRDLDASHRATVVHGRAEGLAHRSDLRGQFDVVTARSFGAPAVTAECAAGFLRVGGRLLVSEPDSIESRWPPEQVALLGLVVGDIHRTVHHDARTGIRELVCEQAGLDGVPRADGVPSRRPLF